MLKVKLYLSLQIFDTVISLVLVVLYSVGNCSRHCNTNPLEQEPKATGLQMKNKKTPNQRAKCMLIFNPEATPLLIWTVAYKKHIAPRQDWTKGLYKRKPVS
jgi:hypothetical protein